MELLKTFTLEENVIPIATSASNTHLLSKSATELWVVALYSPDGDPNEHVSLSILNLDQNRMIRVLDWNLGQFWAGTVKTLRPSARWAAGISVVEGIPVLIYGQRSVLGINSRYSFGFVLLGN